MNLLYEQIACFPRSALKDFSNSAPWDLTLESSRIVEKLMTRLGRDYATSENVAIHQNATVEGGAIIKGPALIGPKCFIASGAYVRGGCWLESEYILGPGVELKSSFVFRGTRLAHFNFVGDSILGCDVNLEAGSIIANYRNERSDPVISFNHKGRRIDTGVAKFGALAGDHTKIGANAVVAPGAILEPATIVGRLSLVDQE